VDDVFWTQAWSDSLFAVSDTGTLVYVPGDATLGRPAWIDRDGRVSYAVEGIQSLIDLALSPDGERIAFQDRDDSLWALDLRRGTRVRLTQGNEGLNGYAVWSRDGSRVLFGSIRTGDWELYSVPADGGSAMRLLPRYTCARSWDRAKPYECRPRAATRRAGRTTAARSSTGAATRSWRRA